MESTRLFKPPWTLIRENSECYGNRFKTKYLPLVRPFSAVPDLLQCGRDAGLRIAVASSAKKDEVDTYLDIARIADLANLTTSADDARNPSRRGTSSKSFPRSSRSRAATPSRLVIRPTMPRPPGRLTSLPSACSAAGSGRGRSDN